MIDNLFLAQPVDFGYIGPTELELLDNLQSECEVILTPSKKAIINMIILTPSKKATITVIILTLTKKAAIIMIILTITKKATIIMITLTLSVQLDCSVFP